MAGNEAALAPDCTAGRGGQKNLGIKLIKLFDAEGVVREIIGFLKQKLNDRLLSSGEDAG